MDAPRQNWSRTVTYGYTAVHEPRTVDEVRRVVAASPSLRPIGTGHTFNALSDGAEAVDLRHLRDVTVSEDRTSVRIGAGLTYTDVAESLRPHDLALHNLASLPHINVVGGVSTATHGSGTASGNLATAVRSLDLVLASGDVVTLRRDQDAAFDGAVVSLGTLGVVTALELDVAPATDHHQVVLTGVGSDEIGPRLAEIMALGHSVSVFTRWDDTDARIWVKSRAGDIQVDAHWPVATTEQHPIDGLDPVNCTPQLGAAGWWADRLPHFRTGFTPSVGDEVQAELHVPREQAALAVEALREIGPRIADDVQVSEIRSVAADALWLSPQHEQDTVAFHFTWVGDQGRAERATALVEEALAPYIPRPHWGKVFSLDVRGAYPRLPDFLALRERLDPDGTFLNPWLKRVLLGR